MGFGKKIEVAAAGGEVATAFVPVLPDMGPQDRHVAMREIMLRILRDTAEVSAAIRTDGRFTLRGVSDILDPIAAPIAIPDLQEHFSFRMDGHMMHAYYVYAPPQRADEFDARAQFDLHELALRVRALNLYCQQAESDEALGVALQAPLLPPLVDAILASAAFFVAYFENMVQMDPFVLRGTDAVGAGHERPSVTQMRETFERCKLMASDAMIEPARLDEFIPSPAWPHLGVEIVRRHEPGDQFAHGVYFPAEYAARIAGGEGEARFIREITGEAPVMQATRMDWVA